MRHTDPISTQQQEYLRLQAVQMVAKRLERAEPPLRREVVEYMLEDPGSQFSLRRSKANFFRLMSNFSGVIAMDKWFGDVRKWKNPLKTILVQVVFLIMVCYPELVLPVMFIYMIGIGAWNYWWRPRTPPYINTRLSYADVAQPGELDELDEEFDLLRPSFMELDDELAQWYPDPTHPDDVVRMRYDRLRTVAGRLQTLVGDLATIGERLQSLLSWRDPLATPIFMALSLVVAVILYLTPFRAVATVMVLYFLRPPLLRNRKTPSLLVNFCIRLPSK